MNTIQRLADARNCLEGKIVAVALSLLMALSFLNVSVFADAALAVEGFDGEVGEKTTEPTPPENDPEKTSESVSTPTMSSNPLRYQQSAESGTASQRAWYPG